MILLLVRKLIEEVSNTAGFTVLWHGKLCFLSEDSGGRMHVMYITALALAAMWRGELLTVQNYIYIFCILMVHCTVLLSKR